MAAQLRYYYPIFPARVGMNPVNVTTRETGYEFSPREWG